MHANQHGLLVLLLALSATNIALSEGSECRYVKKYNAGGRYVNYKEAVDICNVVYNGTLVDEKESSHFHRSHASAIVSKDQGVHFVRSDTRPGARCRVSKFAGINAGVGSVKFSDEDCAATVQNIYCSVRSMSISKTPYCTGQPCHVPHSHAGVTLAPVALNLTRSVVGESQYEWNNEGKCMPAIEMKNNRHWNRIIRPDVGKISVMEAWKDKEVYAPVHRKMHTMQLAGGTGSGSTPVVFVPGNVELRVPYGDRFDATLEFVPGGYKLSTKITTYHLNVRPFIGFTANDNPLEPTTQLGGCSFPDSPDTITQVDQLCAPTNYILPYPYTVDFSYPPVIDDDTLMTFSYQKIAGSGTDDIYVISIEHKFDAGQITGSCALAEDLTGGTYKIRVRAMLLTCGPPPTFINVAFDDFKEFTIDTTGNAVTSSTNTYSFSAMITSSYFDQTRGLTIKILTIVKRNEATWHLVSKGIGMTENIFPVVSSSDQWEIEWLCTPGPPPCDYPVCLSGSLSECIQEWFLVPASTLMIRDSYGIDSSYVINTNFKLITPAGESPADSRFDIDLHVKRTSEIENVHLSVADFEIVGGQLVIGGETIFKITSKLGPGPVHRIRFAKITLCCSETTFPVYNIHHPESTGCNAEGYGVVKKDIYEFSNSPPYQPEGVVDDPVYPTAYAGGGHEIRSHTLTFSEFGIKPEVGFSLTDDAMCVAEASFLLYQTNGDLYDPFSPLHSQTMFSKNRQGRSALRRARERMANSHALNNTYAESTRISNVLKWEKGKMSKIVDSDDSSITADVQYKGTASQQKYTLRCGGKYKLVGKKCVKQQDHQTVHQKVTENVQTTTLSEMFVDFSTLHVTGRTSNQVSSQQRVYSALIVALFLVLLISFVVFTVLFVRAHMHDKKSERRQLKIQQIHHHPHLHHRALYSHRHNNLHVT
jgi:hypothetical protein